MPSLLNNYELSFCSSNTFHLHKESFILAVICKNRPITVEWEGNIDYDWSILTDYGQYK